MPSLSLTLLWLVATVGGPHPAALIGRYDGGQAEIAAGLELQADGRFRYALSYGALDEEATGSWHAEGKSVVLESDPVKPPAFALIDRKAAAPDVVHIGLELPEGVDPQYFAGTVLLADGGRLAGRLTAQGLSLTLQPGQRPASVSVALPMLEILSGPIAVDMSKGLDFRFRFEPNDLGKANLSDVRLEQEDGALILDRHGRTIRFRHLEN